MRVLCIRSKRRGSPGVFLIRIVHGTGGHEWWSRMVHGTFVLGNEKSRIQWSRERIAFGTKNAVFDIATDGKQVFITIFQ